MKHLAIPSASVRGNGRPYTTPGFGDRVHSVTLGYQYGVANDTPVTLHLTEDKVTGGAAHINKRQSWHDIVAIFPEGTVGLVEHPVGGMSNKAWVGYLRAKGIDAECYYYKDTHDMHPNEDVFPLDISAYLTTSPRIPPIDCSLDLPENYVTMQWDAATTKSNKRVPNRKWLTRKYRDEGFDIVTVGAEANTEELRSSVKHVGYAMAHAELHVGVDSGPMHLANAYLPPYRIHLYSNHRFSHHVTRWIANGVSHNRYRP